MKTLLIDDHKINRLYLRTLLEENFPEIQKIDEVGTVAGALFALESTDYDLIFLDMELKDGMGFDVLKVIKDFVYVIIVTSHKEYAIQAFKHNVVDYILKPVHLTEIKNAVKRVVRLQNKVGKVNTARPETGEISKVDSEESLMISFKNEYIAIDKNDILFIKALGKYSEIHVNRDRYTSYKNLKEFEVVMADSFVRVHHSFLVNFKQIISYSRDTSHVKLTNGAEIPVSVRKREELFKRFRVF